VAFDPRQMVQALGIGRFDFSHMLGQQAAFAPYARGGDVSWVIDMAGGYDAYAAERKAAGIGALKDLDKKRRKAEREAGAVSFTAHSRSTTDFDQLFAWKRAQYRATHQTDIFSTSWPMALMRELFASRQPEFGGVLFTLHMDGKLAAAHFHLRGRHTIHAWMIAHDSAFERYSPGMLLFQDILRWMDDTPYARLDLGQGEYRFKRELSNIQQPLNHGFVGVPSPSALVRGAAYGVRQAAESLPLGRVSALPGKAMRRLDLLRGLR
jgi:CelD/BcsL family acetyltransferase involved in cellulose biosynthesis